MKKTGVFYHDVCGKEAYSTLAMGVEEGFESLERENLFSYPNVILYESKPIDEKEISKVHTENWISYVKGTQWWEVSLYSMGGVVQAIEELFRGKIDNALVFGGVGGHHAHRDNAWGGCYFNDSMIGINYAREKFGVKRIAIIDTDTHHGDGTRSISIDDEDILHICFCGGQFGDWNFEEKIEDETKLCFSHGFSDEKEIENVRKEVPGRVRDFKPELIFWVLGLDTHKASYGTAALTERCYPKLAEMIKETADQVCDGKLIVKTACNAPGWVTGYVMPRIVDSLAELSKYEEPFV